MKKLIFTLLPCIIFWNMISCDSSKKVLIDENLILLLSQDVEPSAYTGIPFFCHNEEGLTMRIESRELRMLYNENSFKFDYFTFLNKVLNQKMTLNSNGKVPYFALDTIINKKYKTNNFDDFINLYCNKTEKEQYVLKNGFSENQINSIFYYFFINNYLAIYDDYLGLYFIYRTSTYIKMRSK